MLHRLRAHVAYTTASGLATWSRDQMAVRYEQAVHIREGEPAEEAPVNEITDVGDLQVFRCDLPLMDEAAAADALATLTSDAVFGQAQPIPGDLSDRPSFVEHHLCDHDEDDRSGCTIIDRVES